MEDIKTAPLGDYAAELTEFHKRHNACKEALRAADRIIADPDHAATQEELAYALGILEDNSYRMRMLASTFMMERTWTKANLTWPPVRK